MKNIFLIFLLAAIQLFSSTGAVRSSRTQGAEFLQLHRGARAPALGGAVSARPEGVMAPQYNPAGLAELNKGQFEASYQSLVEGIDHGNFGWSNPWGAGGLGLDLKYIDYGSLTRTTLAEDYSITEAGSFGAAEVAAGLFYGNTLLHHPRYRLNWGWGLRFVHSRIENSGYALGLTGGLQAITMEDNLKTAAVVRNLGSQIRYQDRDDASSLPTDYRLAIAYRILENTTHSDNLWVYYELDFRQAQQHDLSYSAGVEYGYRNFLHLRAGYNDRHSVDSGFSGGLGVKHRNLAVDYAYLPYGKFGTSHRIALKIDI